MVGGVKALIILLVVVCVGCGTTSWVSNPSDPVNVKIEAAIRKAAKKFTGELTKADLEELKSLYLGPSNWAFGEAGRGARVDAMIGKLTKLPKGIEKLTQLETLWLNENRLTNVKKLKKLTLLKELHLQDNPELTKAQIDELQKALPKCRIHW